MAKPNPNPKTDSPVLPALDDPLAGAEAASGQPVGPQGPYDLALAQGDDLRRKPYVAAGTVQTIRQHAKDRMTVWERIKVLQDRDTQPMVLCQNWGPSLDGASIVTGDPQDRRPRRRGLRPRLHRPRRLDGRDQRRQARPPDLHGGRARHPADRHERLARAPSCPPASAASTATPRRSRRCARSAASCRASACMFGYNAGGGAYLPRQGSLHDPGGEHLHRTDRARAWSRACSARTSRADDLGGPACTARAASATSRSATSSAALRTALRLLSYLPEQQPRRSPRSNARAIRSTATPRRSTRCCARPSTRRPASTRRSTSPS